ncbi:uncharacterized protein A4U43_C09F420 [Asparagus officinalis]|uniref:Tyrosine specific protein phosphatases domain-containing protein n=1 Tax=Asparagus officinalis TaxID=4686 RepID=A0A5P1E4H8_ASPOF|nr:uncharacterized protein A4U43_C09F420 [Asparagus officinalis]
MGRRGGRAAFSEVARGCTLAGGPSPRGGGHAAAGGPAVNATFGTCELARGGDGAVPELPRSDAVPEEAYLCVPTWDTRAPSPVQIESAVEWGSRFRGQKKPVFVHCAFGEGTFYSEIMRSVCLLIVVIVDYVHDMHLTLYAICT